MTSSRLFLQNAVLVLAAAVAAAPRISSVAHSTVSTTPAAVGAVSATSASGTSGPVSEATSSALKALESVVRPLSHPLALQSAVRSYFAFKTAHPAAVKKPYLYFVDYGLPSTAKRGYLFDMERLTIVEGPFTVAHGRGSATAQYGTPVRFSNGSGSNASSLGLFVARGLYAFVGHTAGAIYRATGLRLDGESGKFNDMAYARGVVAHGAPYVTPDRAGRSEGCPAMEPDRAARLLPKLANGGVVFLFAPDSSWLHGDPWVNAAAE